MEIKQISVFALKNNQIQQNSAVVYNDSIAIVDAIEGNVVTLWNGKESIKTTEPLAGVRLVVEHDIVQQINNKIVKKTVTTDVAYEHFKAVITLAVHKIPLEGTCVTLYQPLAKGDTVRITPEGLAKKFPNKTLAELKKAIGLVVNIKNGVYSVMVLNETVTFERKYLINQRAQNTKFVYKLYEDCAVKANNMITQKLEEEELQESNSSQVIEPSKPQMSKPKIKTKKK